MQLIRIIYKIIINIWSKLRDLTCDQLIDDDASFKASDSCHDKSQVKNIRNPSMLGNISWV